MKRMLASVSRSRLVTAMAMLVLGFAAGAVARPVNGESAWLGFGLMALVAAVGLARPLPWLSALLGVAAALFYLAASPGVMSAGGVPPAVLAILAIGVLAEFGGQQLIRGDREAALRLLPIYEESVEDGKLVIPSGFMAHRTLCAELGRSKRYHFTVALVLMELATWDHLVAERGRIGLRQLLNDMGARIRELLRAHDSVAYLGRGRYALILPHTEMTEATMAISRVEAELSGRLGLPLVHGIALCPRHADTEEELMSAAEAELELARLLRAASA